MKELSFPYPIRDYDQRCPYCGRFYLGLSLHTEFGLACDNCLAKLEAGKVDEVDPTGEIRRQHAERQRKAAGAERRRYCLA